MVAENSESQSCTLVLNMVSLIWWSTLHQYWRAHGLRVINTFEILQPLPNLGLALCISGKLASISGLAHLTKFYSAARWRASSVALMEANKNPARIWFLTCPGVTLLVGDMARFWSPAGCRSLNIGLKTILFLIESALIHTVLVFVASKFNLFSLVARWKFKPTSLTSKCR